MHQSESAKPRNARNFSRDFNESGYTSLAMTFGALVLVVLAWMRGGFAATESFGPIQWSVVGFLGIFGGALTFLLWSYALQRTTPTRVAISVTINPIVSAIFGAYALDEPITANLVLGLLLVAIGILVASSTQEETTSGCSDGVRASN